MNDAYNIAFKYLISKYPINRGYTPSFQNKLSKAPNKKARKELLDNIKPNNFLVLICYDIIPDNTDDKVLSLLLKQYNCCSNAPKIELELLLTRMGIQFEKRYT